MLIFLHIPKAGGSTMNAILDWNYQRVHGISRYAEIPIMQKWPVERKRSLDCLRGQIYFGIHKDFPQPAQYFTILRDPVQRVISQFFYNRVRQVRQGDAVSKLTMEQFLELEPFQAEMQLRLILGGDSIDDALKKPLPRKPVEQAIANLEEYFCLAGTLENYDESLILLREKLGWSRVYYRTVNVNPNKSDFTSQTYLMLEERCALERALYEHVKAKVTDAICEREGMVRDLATLQRVNRLYTIAHRVAKPVRGTSMWSVMKRVAKSLQ